MSVQKSKSFNGYIDTWTFNDNVKVLNVVISKYPEKYLKAGIG